jgi:hypothetical protein
MADDTTTKVVSFPGVTRLDMPANRIREAIPEDLDEIVVIGFDKAGEFYFAANKADGAAALWLLELAKRRLFACVDGE